MSIKKDFELAKAAGLCHGLELLPDTAVVKKGDFLAHAHEVSQGKFSEMLEESGRAMKAGYLRKNWGIVCARKSNVVTN